MNNPEELEFIIGVRVRMTVKEAEAILLHTDWNEQRVALDKFIKTRINEPIDPIEDCADYNNILVSFSLAYGDALARKRVEQIGGKFVSGYRTKAC